MASLQRLPNEMLLQILHSMDTPQDLHAFISAHPQSLRVFLTNRKRILTSVIKNCLSKAPLDAALAANRLPDRGAGGSTPPPQTLHDDLSRVLRRRVDPWFDLPLPTPTPTDLEFHTDTESLVRLSRLAALACRFTDGLAHRAARVIMNPCGLDGNPEPPEDAAGRFRPLSAPERARIQRALLIYELYCRRFPPRLTPDGDVGPDYTVRDQFCDFLQYLPPWQAEELACVHVYLYTVVESCFEDLEDRIERTFRALPSTQTTHTNPMMAYMPRGTVNRNHETNGTGPESMTEDEIVGLPFDPVSTGLELFGSPNDRAYKLPRFLTKLTSYGLAYVHRLVSADTDTRCEMLLAETPRGRDFLPDAVTYMPHHLPPPDRFPSPHNHQPSDDMWRPGWGYRIHNKPNQGWTRQLQSIYTREHGVDLLEYSPLREMGYAFWDQQRLEDGTVARMLKKAARLSAEEVSWRTKGRRKCLADRLSDVKFDWEERLRVGMEFRPRGVVGPRWAGVERIPVEYSQGG